MLILIYNNNNKNIFTIIISIFNSIKIDNHFVLNIYIYIEIVIVENSSGSRTFVTLFQFTFRN